MYYGVNSNLRWKLAGRSIWGCNPWFPIQGLEPSPRRKIQVIGQFLSPDLNHTSYPMTWPSPNSVKANTGQHGRGLSVSEEWKIEGVPGYHVITRISCDNLYMQIPAFIWKWNSPWKTWALKIGNSSWGGGVERKCAHGQMFMLSITSLLTNTTKTKCVKVQNIF